ncbi:MAG: hypothetical protein V6Z81_09730 [Parvularculales bacterium]
MPNFVTRPKHVFDAIRTFNESLHRYSELVGLLNRFRVFYVLEESGKPFFGPSKFVGYDGLTPEEYLRVHRSLLDGRDTENHLNKKKWFKEVYFGTPDYHALHEQLTVWMQSFDKIPWGGKVKLKVPRPQFRNL